VLDQWARDAAQVVRDLIFGSIFASVRHKLRQCVAADDQPRRVPGTGSTATTQLGPEMARRPAALSFPLGFQLCWRAQCTHPCRSDTPVSGVTHAMVLAFLQQD
jgi:hypothetical protein